MKKIQMLMDVRDPPGYLKDEIRIVSEATCGYFCGLGWARDVSGEVSTLEPDTSPKTIEVHTGELGQSAKSPTVE